MINNDAVCYLALGEHSCCTSLTDGSVRFSVQRTVSVSDILGGTVRLSLRNTRESRVCGASGMARQRQSDCYTYSLERLWCLEDPRRLQNDAAPDPDHRTSTGERAASFRAQARASPAGTPRVSDSRLQPHRPVAQSHKTRRRTTAHTTRAHRGSSVRCLHAQATSPSLRRSARASSKSLARY